MNIIIAGAGEVGVHLAKMLSKESHNIVVLDDESRMDVLTNLDANYDLMTVIGAPTSLSKLKEARCSSADLFIAVTPDEARNLTACTLAAKLGAKKTVARVENQEYMQASQKEFFEQLGINSLICPEILAAKEVADTIRRPWVRQWHEFERGILILIGVKVRENAPILNKELKNLFSLKEPYRIAAIKRGHSTILPGGNDSVQCDDMVYFIATKEGIENIRIMTGKTQIAINNVIIMGGSRIAMLAAELLADDYNVKILESDKNRAEKVKERMQSKVMVITGDGRDVDLLHEEGIEDTDAYIALTGNSETNILSCLAAKRFHVQRSVAEVENNDYISLAENLDIGTVVNKKLITAGHIYQMMLDADVTNMKCLTFADADVAEFIAKEHSKITQRPIKELKLPEKVGIGGLIRGEEGIIVYGDTQIQAGDRVVVFCHSSNLQKIEKYF